MMTWSEGMSDIGQNALANRLEREKSREGNASQGLPAAARSLTAGIQPVKQELDAVRREHASCSRLSMRRPRFNGSSAHRVNSSGVSLRSPVKFSLCATFRETFSR